MSTLTATLPAPGRPNVLPPARKLYQPALRVWLVDDNEFFRTHYVELLGQESGIICDRQFTSPVGLLRALANEPGPDAILLDVQMGPHNGLDAVRPIKDLSPATRVYMFTSCFDTHWRYQAFAAGATDYLLKTYDFKKVVDRLHHPVQPPAAFWQERALPDAPLEKPSRPAATRWFGRVLERLRGARN